MKKSSYYLSILVLGFIIFSLLFINRPRSNTKIASSTNSRTKTTLPEERLVSQDQSRDFKFESLKDESILFRGKKEFDLNSKERSKRPQLEPFASYRLKDESSFYFILKKDRYEAYISNQKQSFLYSTGTYYSSIDEGQTVHTFTSKSMTCFEGFYRFLNFEIAGTFYENVSLISWTSVSIDDKIAESWRLIELENQFFDAYSGKYFSSSTQTK